MNKSLVYIIVLFSFCSFQKTAQAQINSSADFLFSGSPTESPIKQTFTPPGQPLNLLPNNVELPAKRPKPSPTIVKDEEPVPAEQKPKMLETVERSKEAESNAKPIVKQETAKPVVIAPNTDQDNFKFDTKSCSVYSAQELDFGNLGKSKVLFVLKMVHNLPQITIKFKSINPAKVSLLWDSSQVIRKPYFKKSIVASILEEANRPFPFIKSAESGYVSIPWGLRRLQHYMTLFLSKNHMYLGITDTAGNAGQAEVSLRGTTNAITQLAGHCYLNQGQEQAELVSEYVAEGITETDESVYVRKASLAAAYSDGFGLSNFAELEDLLPQLVRDRDLLLPLENMDFTSAYESVGELVDLLGKKKQLTTQLRESTSQEFKNRSQAWLAEYQKIEPLIMRAMELSGLPEADKAGLIETLKVEVKEAQAELSQIKSDISKLTNETIQSYQKELSDYNQQIAPYKEKIDAYQEIINNHQSEIADIETKINRLKELLSSYSSWLSEYKFEIQSQIDEQMNYVEVMEAKQSQQKLFAKIEGLERLISQVEQTVLNMSELSTVFEQIEPAYQAYIQARTEFSMAENSIKQADENLFALNQLYPEFVRNRFDGFLGVAEQLFVSHGNERNLETEVEVHRQLIAEWYEKLDQLVVDARQPLFAATLCTSKNYKSSDSYCFEAEHLAGSFAKEAEAFYEDLSGKDLDSMLSSFMTSVPNPWPGNLQPKPATLFVRLSQEVAVIEPVLLTEIHSTWAFIQHLRWRINTAKRVGRQNSEASFTTNFYRQAHDQLVSQISNEQVRRMELLNQLEPARVKTQNAKEQFSQLENNYLVTSEKFVNQSVESLKQVVLQVEPYIKGENPLEFNFTACTYPMADFSSCRKNILLTQEQVPSRKDTEVQRYTLVAQNVVASIKLLNANFEKSISGLQQKILLVEADKEAYIKENNFQELSQQRDEAEKKLAETEATLALLKQSQQSTQTGIEEDNKKIVVFSAELENLQQTIAEFEGKMSGHKVVLNRTCKEITDAVEMIEKIEKNVSVLLQVGETARQSLDELSVCQLLGAQADIQLVVE